jgi:hypothetical protein
MGSRLSVLESRIAAVEQQLFVLTRGGALTPRRKKDLSPEQRAAIRARLVAGQEKKRKEREEQLAAEASVKTISPKKATKISKKEVDDGASSSTNQG